MTQLKLYTDEDVYGAVSVQLKRMGIDVISTPEASNTALTDEQQLDWATAQGRAIFTFNVSDFCRLHLSRLANDEHHAGIIVSSQRPIGDIVKRLKLLVDSNQAEEMIDSLEFLSNWGS